MSVENQTFPKSVQPGIPKLGPTPKGWKRYRMGDLFDVVSRPTNLRDDQEYDLVTVKRSRGGIERRGHLLGRQISVKSQFLLEEGDFLISKRQIVHGACAVVPPEFSGSIVSNEYSVLRQRPVLSLNYLRYLVHSVYLQQTFFHSSVGVHVEKMIFRLEDWFKWPIHLPPVPEQEKLGNGLMNADAKITLLTDKKTALENYKRGLMQRLFSRELRFTGDDGSAFPDWEERRLGEVATFYKGAGIPKSAIAQKGRYPCVHYGDLFLNHGNSITSLHQFIDIEDGFVGAVGDVLMPGSDVSPTGLCTASALMVDEARLGGDINVIRPLDAVDSQWLAYALVSDRPRVLRLVTGTTVRHLYNREIAKLKLSFPHRDEQHKIAVALSAFDTKIEALSQKIIEMETFKKGLLQKLFV